MGRAKRQNLGSAKLVSNPVPADQNKGKSKAEPMQIPQALGIELQKLYIR
jgi:hypothetical protein